MTARRHDLISGTPKEPLRQRLYRALAGHLADRLGCCPIHGTRLICAACDVTWAGSAAEHVEVEALSDRTALNGLEWPSWPCGRCGAQDSAMCLDCGGPTDDQAYAGLTAEERARFQGLLGHLVITGRPGSADGRHGDDGNPLHEGGSHALRRA
jgi:hypothetical protein